MCLECKDQMPNNERAKLELAIYKAAMDRGWTQYQFNRWLRSKKLSLKHVPHLRKVACLLLLDDVDLTRGWNLKHNARLLNGGRPAHLAHITRSRLTRAHNATGD